VILSAVYMLWMFQRVNYGEVTNTKNSSLPDLLPREWALMVPTIAMAIVMGVLPNVFLRPMEPAVKRTIERVTGRSYASVRPAPPSTVRHEHGVVAPQVRIPDPGPRIPARSTSNE